MAHIARKYNFSYQRVYNWLRRGVPYRVRVEHHEVMRELARRNGIKPELEGE